MTAARLALALSLLLPLAASAQDRPAASHRPHVIQIEEQVIPGTVQRPRVFYVLNRGHMDHASLEQRTSFVREIVRVAPR
jgi:hypothetical protein